MFFVFVFFLITNSASGNFAFYTLNHLYRLNKHLKNKLAITNMMQQHPERPQLELAIISFLGLKIALREHKKSKQVEKENTKKNRLETNCELK